MWETLCDDLVGFAENAAEMMHDLFWTKISREK